MSYEVDVLPVGEGEKSGDAIALRYGNLRGARNEQTIVVIDGGTKSSGEKLVELIQNTYRTNFVDHIICTHPDQDHASGLEVVMENLEFQNFIMHRPWEHSGEICDLFSSISASQLENRFERNLEAAHALEEIAKSKGKNIVEPFQGVKTNSGDLMILGPSREYYQSLLPSFRNMPAASEQVSRPALLQKAATFMEKAITWVDETFEIETLQDPTPATQTSAENRSSAILLFTVEGKKFLFPGDAGHEDLSLAADYAESLGITLTDLDLLIVPHHGSRRNVGPTVLNRIKASNAIISASEGGEPKHPSKRVVNALKRRCTWVGATQGVPLLHYSDVLDRGHYSPHPCLPFYNKVEADD